MQLLSELGDDAKIIAGGQSLMPMLNLRLAAFDHLVDLRRIGDLRGIEVRDDSVWIERTTHTAIGRSAQIRSNAPLLAEADSAHRPFPDSQPGTIGGSIAHADAAAEYPAVTLARLDAEFDAISPRGVRRIAATDFFKGLWGTELAEDEILTGVIVPIRSGRSGYAIEVFARRSGDFAIAGAAVSVRLDADSRVEHCAIALFGLASSVVRVQAANSP